jgi:2-polyprenyl-3-methyl-5-hydroxy-6-metoxy-1,4-benzoquinol methylase
MAVDATASRQHWDHQAATYDDAKARNDGYYSALKALFEHAVEPGFRDRVLEVGCGTGSVLASLVPRSGLGIDVSDRMIERARERFAGADNLEFRVADAAGVAEPGTFDAVICADVLEHVPDWAAVVEAIHAACRSGGLIAITTPNPSWALPLWILEKCHLKMPEGPHQYVGARLIADRLRRLGCTVRQQGTHQMIPAELGGLGPKVSGWAEKTAGLRRLGVIQLVVALKGAAE